MRPLPTCTCALVTFGFLVSSVAAEEPATPVDGQRLRVIMTTDFPPIGVVKSGDVSNTMKSDPDDMQSMVRPGGTQNRSGWSVPPRPKGVDDLPDAIVDCQ